MSDTTWPHAINFIDTITDGNFKHGFDLFEKHETQLHSGIADADIAAMYAYYRPFRLAYATAYGNWIGIKGTSSGGTANFMSLIEDLAGNKARAWDVATQVVYDQKSNKYKALFPHRRSPFQTGSINSRIAAISGLLSAIGTDASLATLKGQINTFNTALLAARDAQQTNFGTIDSTLTQLETARLNAAQAMFKNYGGLVVKYYLTPKTICNYMPVDLLQSSQQTAFNGATSSGETDHILKRKMEVDAHVFIKNDSDWEEQFFCTDGLKDTPEPGQPAIVLPPHSQQDVLASDLGYTDARRHLYIKNNGAAAATWHVKL